MRDIKVIVTAAGAPGASTFIHQLKHKVTERKVEIVAIDMDPQAIGRFISDKFYVVPAATDNNYIQTLKDLILKEKPDIFYCVSSYEVPIVSKYKEELEALGTIVIVGNHEDAELAGNKYTLYEALKNVEGVKIPKYFYPKNLDEFVTYAKELGYPEKRVCFKPHFSKGSRGFRIIDDSISRKDLLLNYKPVSTYMSMAEFISIFEKEEEFPDFLIMEVVEGVEHDVMTISMDGEVLLTTCKTREANRGGVITKGELVDEPQLMEYCKRIIEKIPLTYNSCFQFIDGYLIEINTRVSTFIYQDDLIEPYITIKLALGEYSKEDVKALQSKVQFGRRMLRYFDQLFYHKDLLN
ncbi:ATP-grasp domain-containing protein [Paracrocinitomix mangrovi]|uniref:ATP-grasp domain-containing protein n=1 Tax=Paracrocinitomix mangrovi TaxID=2862509 RepID=UPI001C8D74A0|nr:ATP-grasp domain-containing protein [Paracrocinitomix mangrovi]UKN01573.1 ATP-grasp domain-containing protein [Paracrocinitomix mangrovi]